VGHHNPQPQSQSGCGGRGRHGLDFVFHCADFGRPVGCQRAELPVTRLAFARGEAFGCIFSRENKMDFTARLGSAGASIALVKYLLIRPWEEIIRGCYLISSTSDMTPDCSPRPIGDQERAPLLLLLMCCRLISETLVSALPSRWKHSDITTHPKCFLHSAICLLPTLFHNPPPSPPASAPPPPPPPTTLHLHHPPPSPPPTHLPSSPSATPPKLQHLFRPHIPHNVTVVQEGLH